MGNTNKVKELIEDYGFVDDESIIIFENPNYDTAFVGVIDMGCKLAVYDYDKMIEFLIDNDNMDEDEAADFISYNYSYRQEDEPVILYPMQIDE